MSVVVTSKKSVKGNDWIGKKATKSKKANKSEKEEESKEK